MSVYNSEKSLKRAVDSILNQTFSDFEFIIIDDCSTDNSWNILQEYEKQDKRVRIFRNEKNLGLAENLNKGLKLSKADIVARMDSDDYSHPKRLEKQYSFLLKKPNVDILGTGINLIVNDKCIKPYFYPTNHIEIIKLMQKMSPLAHPTVMYKKDVILSVGGYNKNLKRTEDYDLWLRLKDKVNFANLDEVLLDYTYKVKQPLRTIIHNFKISLKHKPYSIYPWVGLVRNIAINLNLYTPKSLR